MYDYQSKIKYKIIFGRLQWSKFFLSYPCIRFKILKNYIQSNQIHQQFMYIHIMYIIWWYIFFHQYLYKNLWKLIVTTYYYTCERIHINGIQYNNTESFWKMILRKLRRWWFMDKGKTFFTTYFEFIKSIKKGKLRNKFHY